MAVVNLWDWPTFSPEGLLMLSINQILRRGGGTPASGRAGGGNAKEGHGALEWLMGSVAQLATPTELLIGS